MAGALIKVELDSRQAADMLRRAESEAIDSLPLFTEIGSALEKSTRDRIRTGKHAPDGTPWLELTPGWRARKKEKGYAAGILTMRGDLLNSVAFEASGSHVEIIAGPTEYAALHQYGGKPGMAPGAAAVPARPLLGLSAEDEAEIQEAADAWLRGVATP